MNKEVTPLEALEKIGKVDLHSEREDYCFLKNVYVNEYDTIEIALKEYELMKQTKIIVANKNISNEDLEKLKNQRMFVGSLERSEIKPLFDEETQKKLKALDSIKDIINEGYLLLDYPTIAIDVQTSIKKNDYDLLKEVLYGAD